jgi:cyclopropane fatty-acyl-phospholipid synthase-like methyltransferase
MGNFIEDYINGKVDINMRFEEMLKHKDDVFTWNYVWHHYKFFDSRMIPEVIIHSKKQDERIIRSHYDDKNDLFNWFLGPKMIYTSCYYTNENESLEQAQENKMDLIAQKMQLKKGESLLDIGCGWGTLVAHMAKYYGVESTGVTIAQAGADWANRQIKEYGVEDKANILRMDYRDIPRDKKYDKISCLEMAEHVGIKYFKKFMKQCYDMLEDDGIFYLQIAGLRERKHLFQKKDREDLVWGLFMNEYIFSGADASMPLNWDLKRIEKVGFEVQSVENIGIHYSKTIDDWHTNWYKNREKVLEKYGERIFRIYEVFLAWSVVIARHGGSTAYQIVCHKNMDHYDRQQYIGKVNLGETDKFKRSRELESAKV